MRILGDVIFSSHIQHTYFLFGLEVECLQVVAKIFSALKIID